MHSTPATYTRAFSTLPHYRTPDWAAPTAEVLPVVTASGIGIKRHGGDISLPQQRGGLDLTNAGGGGARGRGLTGRSAAPKRRLHNQARPQNKCVLARTGTAGDAAATNA